jgi:hypothetical protein
MSDDGIFSLPLSLPLVFPEKAARGIFAAALP